MDEIFDDVQEEALDLSTTSSNISNELSSDTSTVSRSDSDNRSDKLVIITSEDDDLEYIPETIAAIQNNPSGTNLVPQFFGVNVGATTSRWRPDLICDICNYNAACPSALMQHKFTHTGEKPFQCTICNFKTSQKSYLRQHMFLHTGDKPFQCYLCKYKTAWKKYLRQHMRVHLKKKRKGDDSAEKKKEDV